MKPISQQTLAEIPDLPALGTSPVHSESLEKVDVNARYDLPRDVRYCTRCVVSSQRPRIRFNDDGVCNACLHAERKNSAIDYGDRERMLRELCDKYRRDDGRHDIVVPSSGGKDSGYVAHVLKHEFGMNPLTVTWAPHLYTNIGWQNFQALIHAGLDNILGTPNGQVHRRMTRLCFEEMGEPFQPFAYGQVWFPIQVAANYGINLVMDGENGDVEYGGCDSTEEKPGYTVEDANHFWFSDRPLEYWLDYGFSRADMAIYMPPSAEKIEDLKIERHFFSFYKKWLPQEHFYYTSKNCGFKVNPDGRSEGTYSKYASLDDRIDGFHYYLSLIKFGIARATSDAAHEIRDGHLTREEGVALVKRYDTEFPKKHYREFLEYCDITEDHFWNIVERWRNDKLWKRENGEWVLKDAVWHDKYLT